MITTRPMALTHCFKLEVFLHYHYYDAEPVTTKADDFLWQKNPICMAAFDVPSYTENDVL